jgi:hypothetical protein
MAASFFGGAFSLQTGANANHLLARCQWLGCAQLKRPKNRASKRTRPSTQYTVNDLASPGY